MAYAGKTTRGGVEMPSDLRLPWQRHGLGVRSSPAPFFAYVQVVASLNKLRLRRVA